MPYIGTTPSGMEAAMASVFKQGDAWHIRFYFRGKPYRKSLGQITAHKARRAKQRVEARLSDPKSRRNCSGTGTPRVPTCGL